MIGGKDSVFNVYSNSTFTTLEVSAQGDFIVAGTQDSGWVFIPTATPDRYVKIPSKNGFETAGFYFDETRNQLWVQENPGVHGFKNLLQYDIGGTVPVMMSSISHQSLGLAEIDDAVFAFDFRHNKLYVQSGIRQLLLFDLGKRTI